MPIAVAIFKKYFIMKKLKVLTVVGTRPEIIRLSRVMASLDDHCDHVLVHTGQNYDYELNQVFFDDLGVRKPDYFLNSAADSSGAAHTIGNLIIAVDQVLALFRQQGFADAAVIGEMVEGAASITVTV